MQSQETRRRGAFTLIEVLVVIAIIGILIALLLPAIQKVREAASRMRCLNNLKQLGLGLHNYHNSYSQLPWGYLKRGDDPDHPTWKSNWLISVLPYIERSDLYVTPDKWDSGKPRPGSPIGTFSTPINVFACPSDTIPDPAVDTTNPKQFWGLTSYGGNGGIITKPEDLPHDSATGNTTDPATGQAYQIRTNDGVLFRGSKVKLNDIKDGASQTLLIGEWSHYDPAYERFCGANTVQDEASVTNGWWGSAAVNDTVRSTRVPINWKFPPNATYCMNSQTRVAGKDIDVTSSYGPSAAGHKAYPGAPAFDTTNYDDRYSAFGSQHPGGANFVFCDGSGRFISQSLDLPTLRALSTRNGGEVFDEGKY